MVASYKFDCLPNYYHTVHVSSLDIDGGIRYCTGACYVIMLLLYMASQAVIASTITPQFFVCCRIRDRIITKKQTFPLYISTTENVRY